MQSVFDLPPLCTTRPGVDVWLRNLWFIGFEHGTTLVARMQEAAYGKFAVSPVDADMVLEELVRLQWVVQVGKPTPAYSMRAFAELGHVASAPCWYGYEPVRESSFALYAKHRESYPIVAPLPGDNDI